VWKCICIKVAIVGVFEGWVQAAYNVKFDFFKKYEFHQISTM
jgi:hypothetical protein